MSKSPSMPLTSPLPTRQPMRISAIVVGSSRNTEHLVHFSPKPQQVHPATDERQYPWTDPQATQNHHGISEERRREHERENPFQTPSRPAQRGRSRSRSPLGLPAPYRLRSTELLNTDPQTPLRDQQFDASLPFRPRISVPVSQTGHAESQQDDSSLSEDEGSFQRQLSEVPNERETYCEFSSPCRMTASPDGMHFRKVVSHIFGRNKASTKLFPPSVWVHYCRKHYQRARYRADQWPFTQCELLLESLRRMEDWAGVESFELTLRRREVMRVDTGDSGDRTSPTASGAVQSRRKHPTAITAPVPSWLRQHVGRDKSFADIRRIILQVREHMVRLREEERKKQVQPSVSTRDASIPVPANNIPRRSGWRAARSGAKDTQRQHTSRVRFPDVEILPTFKAWVLKAALRERAKEPKDKGKGEKVNGNHDERTRKSSDKGKDEASTPVEIGRAGSNRGRSMSQKRRSERLFLKMVTRITPRGSVQKPNARDD